MLLDWLLKLKRSIINPNEAGLFEGTFFWGEGGQFLLLHKNNKNNLHGKFWYL